MTGIEDWKNKTEGSDLEEIFSRGIDGGCGGGGGGRGEIVIEGGFKGKFLKSKEKFGRRRRKID